MPNHAVGLSLKRFVVVAERPPDWRAFDLHHFAARLDRLSSIEQATAAAELETLIGETIELMAQHMLPVDVSGVRQKNRSTQASLEVR